MPIFQYDNYRNPYGPSIAEALAHQADPQAAAALRSGDIEARAAQQQGALRAQQFSTLGAIPGEIQAERDRAIVRQRAAQQQQIGAQQLEMGGYQVDAARRDAKTRNVMDAELRNPANRNPDGSLNDERFMQALQQQDVGAWQQYGALAAKNQQARLELLKTASEIDKNTSDAREKAQKQREAQITYLGKASLSAYDALQQQPDDPLHARDTANAYVADAVASGAITPQQGAQFHLQTARAGPDQLAGTFLQMTDPELRAKIAKEQAETAASRASAARPVIVGPGASALAPPPTSGAPAGAPAAPPTVLYTAPETGKAYQKSSVLLDGKPAEVLLDPTPGGKIYDLSGAPIDQAAARIRPIPPASVTIHNDQKTATPMPAWALDDSRPAGAEANVLDASIRMTPNGLHQAALNYIANGQFPPTGRGSDPIAVAQRAAITSKVGAIAAASGLDEPALRAFYKANGQSLAQQQKMQDAVQGFMATADKNAALLQESLKKIPDTGSPLFNQPVRAFASKVAGNRDLAQFATYLQSVQNEYGRIISQPNLAGQLTDSARHEAETLASPTATVPQLLASLQALQNEGTNRLVSVGEQIQRIQQRMQAGPGGAATSGGGTGFSVTTPDGVRHTFPSAAALDGFKRVAGLP